MLSKNLKYYRLKNRMSKKALAEAIGVTPMAVTNWEDGSRRPGMETLSALAKTLGVRVSDFLAVRSGNITFRHGEFRKNASLSKTEQEFVRESVEEYFSRFMTVIEVLGGEVLPAAPECSALPLSQDDQANALALRAHLGFSPDGPIEDLIGKLENKGILIFECPVDNPAFSGMNGFVGDRPYIVLNPAVTSERKRSTAVHELAHLMFVWPEELTGEEVEARATAIAGAFLFPEKDALRELGVRRSSVTGDMVMTAKEYGISVMMLVMRAKLCGIISESAAKTFYVWASGAGWRTSEPGRIAPEKPLLFEQLVYRAVNEEEISVQRGAELLKQPFAVVRRMRKVSGV